MKNTVVWMQLATSDPQKAKAFYSKLFQWTLIPKEKKGEREKTYIEIDAGGPDFAGIHQSEKGAGSHWVPFVSVDDIHESTEKAENLGAQILVPATLLEDEECYFSVFIDPTGAILGMNAPK